MYLNSINRTIHLVLAAVIVRVSLQWQLSGTQLLPWSRLALVLTDTFWLGLGIRSAPRRLRACSA